ncbi:intraflagellar transport protein 88 homolog [Babylonia areolata]|uniref:intraflagellar transport protein 88 homolog n=1 Tax=Babylonia areolata TaxID=304850 RepID=UPI003FD3DAA7
MDDGEDDVYGGFNDFSAALDTDDLGDDEQFQKAVLKTSHGRRPPPTAMRGPIGMGGGVGVNARLMTAARGRMAMPSSMGRPITSVADNDSGPRPMTAVKGVGFSSTGRAVTFDPMNQASKGPAPPLESKPEDTPEEKVRKLERKVSELIEESCLANSRGEFPLALEKAKEAGRKERVVVKQREQLNLGDQVNLDLTFSVLFNLANQYTANEMFAEALNTYQVIVKNRMFTNAGRLKVNMGNIYFHQRNYPKAIKMYRMALDQLPNHFKEMRMKIMQNIGMVFVKMGQYSDAITSFEHIMSESPNFKTGFNLLLCYFSLGDRSKMQSAFQKLLTVDLKTGDEDKYLPHGDDKQASLLQEVIKNDALRQIERERIYNADRCIKIAAKVISPAVEASFADGYDWCIDQVKTSSYVELAHELEIDKAVMFLKLKDFQQAIETLKSFEKKDTKVASTAAANLSFLYFLEGDFPQADKYAEVALQADRYNPSALVNKGNILFARNDFEKAREFFKDALSNDSSCVEAMYNLGLTNKRLGQLDKSVEMFHKLHSILRSSPQVMYQMADLHEKRGDTAQATEWFMQLITLVPSDPSVLGRVGDIYDSDGDKSQAFQYYYDSYRYLPSNISVIEWLGAYYIDSQFCEKAISYFERAALVQPMQVKWHLMTASCHRRSGNYNKALEVYQFIHKKFPDNVECLKFLVRLCTDLGMKEAQDYATKLKKAEKAKEQRDGQGDGGKEQDSDADAAQKPAARERRRPKFDDEEGKPFQASKKVEVDATYSDPLGPSGGQTERPRTASKRKEARDDDFGDEELGDDLLPD